jgi:hypothetical protein
MLTTKQKHAAAAWFDHWCARASVDLHVQLLIELINCNPPANKHNMQSQRGEFNYTFTCRWRRPMQFSVSLRRIRERESRECTTWLQRARLGHAFAAILAHRTRNRIYDSIFPAAADVNSLAPLHARIISHGEMFI